VTWSRTQLAEHLYNEETDRDSNVIDVFVARLRRKLDAAGLPGNELIRTQRGAGYRFDPSAVTP
jgi:two-component system response regulator PhoP